ncbi:hypothetical protein LTR37_021173 [Vermiconidia calcicola]|uniref:Uncharacterized protein n=1 Tax=Vermiconidia calcicola TaxID=1690605 RepID=A0ACC3MAM0_9PEZI|nr:hypothetical protein LTR37_021173 [Vermiconidia calcicola]
MAPSEAISEPAQSGFAKSAAYDQHRPAYTSTVVEVLLKNLGVSGKNGAVIVDLAAGTGKFTEALAARDEDFEIIAVEPHGDMRRVLDDKKLPNVTVKAGKADSIPLDDGSVDAVICAQSFHWFANMASLHEIRRILQAHGGLGMCWNVDDYNAAREHKAKTDWEAKMHELTWTFGDEQPRYRHMKWRDVFEKQVKSTPMKLLTAGEDQLFSLPLAEDEEKFEVRLSKEKLWERYNTLSHIAVLDGEKRERTYNTFMDILSGTDVEIDENGNVVAHGRTHIVWAMKIPAEGRAGLAADGEPDL